MRMGVGWKEGGQRFPGLCKNTIAEEDEATEEKAEGRTGEE